MGERSERKGKGRRASCFLLGFIAAVGVSFLVLTLFGGASGTADAASDGLLDTDSQSALGGLAEPAAEVVEPVAEAVVEPVAEAVVEPVAEAVVEPVAEAVVEPVAEAVVEPVATAVVEPVAEAVVEPVAEAVVEPVAEAVVEPVATAVVEPVAETVVEPVATAVVEPVATAVVEPVVEPVVEAVVEIEQTVVGPIVEPVVEAASPAVEHVVEVVSSGVVRPAASLTGPTVDDVVGPPRILGPVAHDAVSPLPPRDWLLDPLPATPVPPAVVADQSGPILDDPGPLGDLVGSADWRGPSAGRAVTPAVASVDDPRSRPAAGGRTDDLQVRNVDGANLGTTIRTSPGPSTVSLESSAPTSVAVATGERAVGDRASGPGAPLPMSLPVAWTGQLAQGGGSPLPSPSSSLLAVLVPPIAAILWLSERVTAQVSWRSMAVISLIERPG